MITYLYLGEIVQQIKHDIGIDIAASMVCRLLKKHGHTRKKIHQIAKQKYTTPREKFMAHISLFDGEAFVWLDETGTDRRDQLRKYGYALRGVTPVYHRILIRGDRYQWHSHTWAHPGPGKICKCPGKFMLKANAPINVMPHLPPIGLG